MNLLSGIAALPRVRAVKRALLAASVLFLASLGILLIGILPRTQGHAVVPLHYNVHFGIDDTGEPWQLFLPAVIVLLLSLLNFFLAFRLWNRERVVAGIFIGTIVVLHALLLVQTICTLLLIITYA